MKFNNRIIFLLLPFFVCGSIKDLNSSPIKVNNKEEFDYKQELKQGNLLLGIKQYIGSRSFLSEKDFLIFEGKNKFLELEAENGIKHKSKKIQIIWKKIPLDKPIVLERMVSKAFSSFESAKKEFKVLERLGYKPIIVYPNNWEIWLSNYSSKLEKRNFKYQKVIREFEIIPYLTNEFTYKRLEGPISINSEESIKINKIEYGSNFYLKKDSYGSWTFIEKIKMPKYLEGVVPHEIGSNSPLNALAAQTILARTWAIANQSRFKIDGYHLCNSVQCQVYKRKYPPSNSIKSAIKQTKGMVIKWRGKPINAVYHATNGGVSASIAEAWEVDSQPYLLNKLDGNSKWRKSHQVPILTPQKVQNILMDNDGAYGKNHYLFRWNKNITEEELKSYFQLAQKDIKFPVKIKIEQRGNSGRVVKLKIISLIDKKILILEKGEIRKILKKLPSTLFIIKNSSPKNWEFYGGGFGHGVGMSQAGAIEMAEKGWSVNQILNHYYPGTEIDSLP